MSCCFVSHERYYNAWFPTMQALFYLFLFFISLKFLFMKILLSFFRNTPYNII